MTLPALPRTTVLALAGTVAACCAAALVIRDPHTPGSFAVCPSLLLTGMYCAGCGSLRATHDLLTGNVGEAFSHNPLTAFALVWLAWWWVSEMASSRGRTVTGPPASSRFAMGLLVVVVGFTVLRNIPGTGLAP